MMVCLGPGRRSKGRWVAREGAHHGRNDRWRKKKRQPGERDDANCVHRHRHVLASSYSALFTLSLVLRVQNTGSTRTDYGAAGTRHGRACGLWGVRRANAMQRLRSGNGAANPSASRTLALPIPVHARPVSSPPRFVARRAGGGED